ncbi:MAG: transposase [bacterium]
MENATAVPTNTDAAVSETATQFLRKARKATRRRFTAEDKIRIVIEGMKREIAVSELCRREGISSAIYYTWLKDFMEAGKSRLKGDSLRNANRGEVSSLRRENEQLKALLADQMLELNLLKKSLTD